MATDFSIVDTRDGIVATWPVMRQLRPHLAVDEYVALVERLQEEHGFRLAQMRVDGDIVAVAGLRFGEWLPRGRYLEIEDFVTSDSCRSQGHGSAFFDWIADYGRAAGCCHLRLVSAVHREAAHRFYRRKGMHLEACYFSLDL